MAGPPDSQHPGLPPADQMQALAPLGWALLYSGAAVVPFFAAVWLGASALGRPDTHPLVLAAMGLIFLGPGVLLALAAGVALRRTALFAYVRRRPALTWGLVTAALALVLPVFADSGSAAPEGPAAVRPPSFWLAALAAVELSVAFTWLMAVRIRIGVVVAVLLALVLCLAALLSLGP